MSPHFATVLILAAGFAAATAMILGMAWIRSRNHRMALDRPSGADAERLVSLTRENEALRTQVTRQEERLAVLERIATDPAERTAREIESLR